MPPDEADLVRRVVATRDPDAFGQLYELYIDRIGRYIYYKVGLREDAEDLTEQVFLKAWENAQGFRGEPGQFPVWIYRLAHNLVIDYRRTHKQTTELHEFIEDSRPLPEEIVGARLDNEMLQAAIAKLTDEQQQVVILRFIHGLPHAQVANIMGKNEVAVRGIQYRAIVALQRILRSTADLAR
jgi:RNA polymerase sigma-70 factor (ECF subfamily)